MITGSLDLFLTASGELVLTLTNNGYKFYTLNLVRHLQAAKVPWTLCVICADAKSYMYFKQEGIPCRRVAMPLPDMGPQASPFGTRNFQLLNRMKLDVVSYIMAQPAVRVGVYLDSDIAVYRDFLPDISARLSLKEDPAYLFQCDNQDREQCSGATCANFCTGFFAWSGGKADPRLFSVEDKELWKEKPEDQVYVNRRLRAAGVTFEVLPRLGYPNGMFASFKGIKDTAYLLHYNWLVGDMKRKKMAANGDWLIPY
jgi:hypothetical protein